MKTVTFTPDELTAVQHAIDEDLCFIARNIAEDDFDQETIDLEHPKARLLFSALKKLGLAEPDTFWGEPEDTLAAYEQMKKDCA